MKTISKSSHTKVVKIKNKAARCYEIDPETIARYIDESAGPDTAKEFMQYIGAVPAGDSDNIYQFPPILDTDEREPGSDDDFEAGGLI
jgi:hypothetical protein